MCVRSSQEIYSRTTARHKGSCARSICTKFLQRMQFAFPLTARPRKKRLDAFASPMYLANGTICQLDSDITLRGNLKLQHSRGANDRQRNILINLRLRRKKCYLVLCQIFTHIFQLFLFTRSILRDICTIIYRFHRF